MAMVSPATKEKNGSACCVIVVDLNTLVWHSIVKGEDQGPLKTPRLYSLNQCICENA